MIKILTHSVLLTLPRLKCNLLGSNSSQTALDGYGDCVLSFGPTAEEFVTYAGVLEARAPTEPPITTNNSGVLLVTSKTDTMSEVTDLFVKVSAHRRPE